jgi:catechol 2,3-dioxygenase-like lactoylglutathione lyase family enzyme
VVEPLSIHHVSINVSDLDAALAFYTDVLGGTVRTDRPALRVDGAWIDLGAQQVHLLVGEVPPRVGQHFAIRVADLDAAVSELRAQGIAVRDPSGVGTNRQTFVTDPSGNLVELHEVGSAG